MPLLTIALAVAAAGAAGEVRIARLTIRERVIIRVDAGPPPPPRRTEWRERHGPRCVPKDAIVGAAVIAPNGVDFVLRGGRRLRARFAASCPALDYYGGFYIIPPADGQVCAGRDAIRDRAGGDCEIDRFRRLVPVQGGLRPFP